MKQYLQTIEYRDERDRCMGHKYFIVESLEKQGLELSHGLSYLGARKAFKEINNKPMGLEKNLEPVEEVFLQVFGDKDLGNGVGEK